MICLRFAFESANFNGLWTPAIFELTEYPSISLHTDSCLTLESICMSRSGSCWTARRPTCIERPATMCWLRRWVFEVDLWVIAVRLASRISNWTLSVSKTNYGNQLIWFAFSLHHSHATHPPFLCNSIAIRFLSDYHQPDNTRHSFDYSPATLSSHSPP